MDIRNLALADFLGPVFFAGIFICLMSLVREPARQKFNAVLVAGAGAAYFSSGFGIWEQAFTCVATIIAYFGLRDYRYIALAWVLHAGWDILHHMHGDPIIIFIPKSSLGCAIFDPIIAIWFFYGAPSVWEKFKIKKS